MQSLGMLFGGWMFLSQAERSSANSTNTSDALSHIWTRVRTETLPFELVQRLTTVGVGHPLTEFNPFYNQHVTTVSAIGRIHGTAIADGTVLIDGSFTAAQADAAIKAEADSFALESVDITGTYSEQGQHAVDSDFPQIYAGGDGRTVIGFRDGRIGINTNHSTRAAVGQVQSALTSQEVKPPSSALFDDQMMGDISFVGSLSAETHRHLGSNEIVLPAAETQILTASRQLGGVVSVQDNLAHVHLRILPVEKNISELTSAMYKLSREVSGLTVNKIFSTGSNISLDATVPTAQLWSLPDTRFE